MDEEQEPDWSEIDSFGDHWLLDDAEALPPDDEEEHW